MATGKKVNGRPTKYKPEYCSLLIDHMEKGFSFPSFAGVVGVDFDTVYEWAKVHKDFSDAKRKAVSKNMIFWEKVLTSASVGQLRDHNMTGIIFSMKNKFPEFYRDRKEIVAEVHNSYDKLSDEELRQKLKEILND